VCDGTFIYGSGASIALYPYAEGPVVVNHHASKVTAVALSPNGLWVATGDAKGTVKLWPSRGERMQKYEYRPISSHVRFICWSPDSRKIAMVGGESGRGAEGCCIAYDTGSAVGQPFSGHSKPITCVAYRPVPPFRIITGSEDTSVIFHEGPPFKFMKSCQTAHSNFVNSVAFSQDGSRAFSSGSDGVVAIYAGDSGDFLCSLDPKLPCSIWGIAPCSNGVLYAACGDKKLRAISGDNCSILNETLIGDGNVGDIPLGITSDPKKNCVMVITLDGAIREYNVGENSELLQKSTIVGGSGAINSIVSHKNGVLVNSQDGSVWSLSKPFMTSKPVLIPCKKPIKAAAGLLVDLTEILGISASGDELFNIKTGQVKKYPVPSMTTRVYPCKAVGFAVGEKGEKICQVHQPSRSFDFDSKNGETVGVFAVSEDGETIVVVPCNEKLNMTLQQSPREFIVNMRTRIKTTMTIADIVNAAVSPDGTYIALASGAQELHVYKRTSGDNYVLIPETEKVWTYHKAKITAMAWADKTTLITGGLDKTVHVWNVERPMSGPIVSFRDLHKEGVSALYAVREQDGSLLVVSGGFEGSLRLTPLV
jgi:WD40 repeat protein